MKCFLHRAEEASFNDQEREKFEEFVRAFCEHLVPHVNCCLGQLYPVAQLSQTFGISAMEITKMVCHLSLVISCLIKNSCLPVNHSNLSR